jgi:hypothetical protein
VTALLDALESASKDKEEMSSSRDTTDSIDSRSVSGSEFRDMIPVCSRTESDRGRGETSDSSSEGGREIPRSDDSD